MRLIRLSVAAWSLLALGASAGTVTYIYTDPLGTPLVEADAGGNITARFDYRPYGEQALGVAPAGPGYAGHVSDADTNLVYMQARFYDPAVGRFLSTDPSGVRIGDGFTFNRFAYANGNPIVNVDPDGRDVRSGNPIYNARLVKFINQYAAGGFAFKGDRLVQVGAAASSAGKSAYYADRLAAAIKSDKTLTLNISSEHVGQSGTSYNINALGGGGVTEGLSNGNVNLTINGEGAFTSDVNGTPLYEEPAEVLMHEVVGHALPYMGQHDTGNAVANENKARAQAGLTQRQADPKHTETNQPPPPPPPSPSCGILCAQ